MAELQMSPRTRSPTAQEERRALEHAKTQTYADHLMRDFEAAYRAVHGQPCKPLVYERGKIRMGSVKLTLGDVAARAAILWSQTIDQPPVES